MTAAHERATAPSELFDSLRKHERELALLAPELTERLRDITGHTDPALRMYVVGAAGVGKSTLLNALLSDRMSILPHGGFGSLTACATRIRYSSDPYAAIAYRGAYPLSALVDHIELLGSRAASSLLQGRLLVQGNQFGDAEPGYVIHCLREAIAGRMWSGANEIDRGRLFELARLIDAGAPRLIRHAGTDLRAFIHDLEVHAAGFLAPVVDEVEIGWDADLLAPGIELVDLPGVGVANDSYAEKAKNVLVDARAVMLVVDRSGLTQAAAALLAPFFDAMQRDPAHRTLVVAIVKVDSLANDRRANDPRKTWMEHFDQTCGEAVNMVRRQLHTELDRLAREREQTSMPLQRVIAQPVAPLEHQRVHAEDPEVAPRVRGADGARIVALRDLLRGIALTHQARVARVVDEALREAIECGRADSARANTYRAVLASLTEAIECGG